MIYSTHFVYDYTANDMAMGYSGRGNLLSPLQGPLFLISSNYFVCSFWQTAFVKISCGTLAGIKNSSMSVWLKTTKITRKKTCCYHFIDCSFPLAPRDSRILQTLLYQLWSNDWNKKWLNGSTIMD